MLRRNLVVAGINLTALQGERITVGPDVVLELSRAVRAVLEDGGRPGPGGYNALRGHGGWNARVLRSGTVAVGDEVRPVP